MTTVKRRRLRPRQVYMACVVAGAVILDLALCSVLLPLGLGVAGVELALFGLFSLGTERPT